MEIITGRSPVDYSRPQGEVRAVFEIVLSTLNICNSLFFPLTLWKFELLQVNLIEWLKTMVGSRKAEEVVDPKLSEKPSPKALKRALLVALRCVDPDASKRPKMGHVIHMLEADDLLFRDVCSFFLLKLHIVLDWTKNKKNSYIFTHSSSYVIFLLPFFFPSHVEESSTSL